ncbi:MAG: class I SAM-dependent methyltransferase [Bacteroidetes bacterium]|nr:class I SAM-dependent methyltransferase [Bacteroidota bacterium]
MLRRSPFESHAELYDSWYDKYPFVFQSEVAALKAAMPVGILRGMEVGLGSGRISVALGIKEGVEPALEMRRMALERGIEVLDARAEYLPYKDLQFDFVLMSTCISYFSNLQQAFGEAHRVLKRGGTLIVGFIDKNSIIGQEYEAKRQTSLFYKDAVFYTAEKVADEIKNAGFSNPEFSQTLFEKVNEINALEHALPGYGKGSYVVIRAFKK